MAATWGHSLVNAAEPDLLQMVELEDTVQQVAMTLSSDYEDGQLSDKDVVIVGCAADSAYKQGSG
jgi:hypothetical protein